MAGPYNPPVRVGIGSYLRPLEPGRVLVLGGVKIEGAWGCRGPGDGDVLLLAVTDALLGAAGLGDLEDHLPEEAREVPRPGVPSVATPSAVRLAEAGVKARARGLVPANVDATVVLDRPDVRPHRPRMAARIAEVLGVDPSAVNVKAVAPGGIGVPGRGEGILAHAVVLLEDVGGR